MVRLYEQFDENRHGKLEIVTSEITHIVEVYYSPPPRQLELAKQLHKYSGRNQTKILEINRRDQSLTIYPTNTFGDKSGFLEPKYNKIKRITLAEATPVIKVQYDDSNVPKPQARSITFGPTKSIQMEVLEEEIENVPPSSEDILSILESLPPTFTKDYDYGLGLAKPYRFIVDAVEELSDCTEIFISDEQSTEINNDKRVFYISRSDFETMRKFLNSTTDLSQKASIAVKSANTYNYLADKTGKPSIPVRIGRHQYRKLFTRILESDGAALTDDEQEEILGAMSNNVKVIAETKTERLTQLQCEIELVNLEALIGRYEKMLVDEHPEEQWQRFFNTNPFILGLAFGYPIIKVKEKAYVGGHALSDSGYKIADFVVKNSMTNNTAIVEIKTPSTKLMNRRPYRGDVYSPSEQLSGAVNQVLDQKYRFEKAITQIKEDSCIYDINTYSVHCCLVIGTISEVESRRKSFEVFRGNSKNVNIITYDELLEKLNYLFEFLSSSEEDVSTEMSDDDLPF